jgi:predicted PurR-regulated permease PerM
VIGKALVSIADEAPQLIPNGLAAITHWVKSIPFLSSDSMQLQIDKYSAQAGVALGDALKSFLTQGIGILQSSSGMILGFVSMPVFLFFILKDWDKLRGSFQKVLPAWALTHAKSILSIIQNVTVRYLRGQMILGFAVGLLAFILLMVMGIDFALPLAALAAVTELVPMIGPWIGGIAGALVTLAVAPEKVIWVAFGYLAIQLLENNLLVPRIQGTQMNINPAFIIVISILGAHFAGILGFVIALPLSMTTVEIVKYLHNSARDGTIS